jgi:uncharacterized protein
MHKLLFTVGNETLVGILYADSPDAKADVISFHGAGQSDKSRVSYLVNTFRAKQKNVLVFDFSGHGESTGDLHSSSLHKRVTEATEAIRQFCVPNPILIGTSMGGYVALKLMATIAPPTVILFAPAIYSKDAYFTPFTDAFSTIIRTPLSWQHNDLEPGLEQFAGKLLIFIGENDEVIPPGVIDLIATHTPRARRREIIKISDATHALHSHISTNPEVQAMIEGKIQEFI